MKKPLELADTTFRAYKKDNGNIALHLKTFLIVYANAAFRAKIHEAKPSLKFDEPPNPVGLSAFMKEFPHCWLQLPDKKERECVLSLSCYPVTRLIEHPAGERWVTHKLQDIADEESTFFYLSAKMTVPRHENIFGKGNVSDLIIANLKMDFNISFPGRPSGEIIVFHRKVAIKRQGRSW